MRTAAQGVTLIPAQKPGPLALSPKSALSRAGKACWPRPTNPADPQPSYLLIDLSFKFLFLKFIDLRERETSICCSTY